MTSAGLFREMLHRYVATGRRDAPASAFAALRGVVDEVSGIGLDDVERARALVTEIQGLCARDALHVTVMERQGIERILSFDNGFARLESIVRNAD